MALLFNAVTEVVNCGSDASLDNLTTATALIWVYPVTLANDGLTLCKSGGGVNHNWLNFSDNAGNFALWVQRATLSLAATSDSGEVNADAWNFMGAVHDTGGVDGDQKLYWGDLSTLIAEVGGYGVQRVGTGAVGNDAGNSLGIGNYAPAVGWGATDAVIAWIGLWNRVLILEEMRAQQFRPHKTAGCVGFWHLGFNGTGTQADWSGNGNNGTVTGATVADHVPLGPPFWMTSRVFVSAAPPPVAALPIFPSADAIHSQVFGGVTVR